MKLSTNNIVDLRISDFLGKKLECECGKIHSVSVEHVLIEKNALEKIPDVLRKLGFKNPLIVADKNTYNAAGKTVENILAEEKVQYKKFVFNAKEDLVPDEDAVGKLFIQVEQDTDVLLTVGSGTLNDLSKYVSYKLGISSIIVATSPSMDGFASNGAALIVGSLKTTFEAAVPKAIIGDVNVLKNAPVEMILAGFGDLVGKYSSLNDWRISKVINKEYYCDVTVKMVKESVQKCINNTDGIKEREDTSIKNLMEGLVLTGIAMSFVGNSRPASGAEHHLAHYWEMMFLFEGKKAVLHGRKVGIATVITAKLHELLSKSSIDFNKAIFKANSFEKDKWKENVEKTYKKAAQGIIEIDKKEHVTSIEKRLERINVIKENLDEIIRIIGETPSADEVQSVLSKVGAPVTPKAVGIDKKDVINGIIMAKEVRTRYTILSFLSDIDLLEEFAYNVSDYLDEIEV